MTDAETVKISEFRYFMDACSGNLGETYFQLSANAIIGEDVPLLAKSASVSFLYDFDHPDSNLQDFVVSFAKALGAIDPEESERRLVEIFDQDLDIIKRNVRISPDGINFIKKLKAKFTEA